MHNAATGVTMEFKYNHEGLRTRKVKKVNGTVTETTDYILKGKHIVAMKKNTDTYYFTYDASGKPATVTYNGVKYTYVKNLQGDIVAILDASGTLVVEYRYDAWGAPTSILCVNIACDDLAFDNPFRYRGYVWDEETELYYLSSRYYNPEIGRFINADIIVSTGQGILDSNMFAYCLNNPVCRRDASGDTSRKNKGENDFNHTDDYKEFAGGRIDNDGVYSSGNTNGGSNGGTGNSGTNNSTIQIGGGHGSKMHAAKINRFIEALKKARQFLKIYGNRALKTAGLEGNQRPDVIAYKIDGRIEVWEFASPSQAIGTKGYQDLEAKIKAMQAANPSVHFYPIIPWEDN